MGSLDGKYWPFTSYPLYSQMAPCMRSCNGDYSYNGCDNSNCWCNKANLDLRIATITRCASTSCTFANMNTQTDVSILSGIQVQYCVDHNHSPAGMALPSSAEASVTSPSGGDGPQSTTTGAPTGTGTESRTKVTSGPSSTGQFDFPSSTSSPSTSSSSSSMSTAAKAGIAVGGAFCILLLVAIILLLRRRKRPAPVYIPPPTSNPSFHPQGGPPMAPTPYSAHGPFSPPPTQQGNTAFDPRKGDVSPVEEKAPMVGIARKEVGKRDVSPQSSPAPTNVHPASPAPTAATTTTEVPGSMPPTRYEAPHDNAVANLNQYPPQQQGGYQGGPQGQWQGQQGVHEVDGANGQRGQQGYAPYGQQYAGAYELGPGR